MRVKQKLTDFVAYRHGERGWSSKARIYLSLDFATYSATMYIFKEPVLNKPQPITGVYDVCAEKRVFIPPCGRWNLQRNCPGNLVTRIFITFLLSFSPIFLLLITSHFCHTVSLSQLGTGVEVEKLSCIHSN